MEVPLSYHRGNDRPHRGKLLHRRRRPLRWHAARSVSASRETAKAINLGPNPLDGRSQIAHHELVREPEHVAPDASERPIPSVIRASPSRVVAAIDLHHEPHLRGVQIRDEPPRKRHLRTPCFEPVLPGGRVRLQAAAHDCDGAEVG